MRRTGFSNSEGSIALISDTIADNAEYQVGNVDANHSAEMAGTVLGDYGPGYGDCFVNVYGAGYQDDGYNASVDNTCSLFTEDHSAYSINPKLGPLQYNSEASTWSWPTKTMAPSRNSTVDSQIPQGTSALGQELCGSTVTDQNGNSPPSGDDCSEGSVDVQSLPTVHLSCAVVPHPGCPIWVFSGANFDNDKNHYISIDLNGSSSKPLVRILVNSTGSFSDKVETRLPAGISMIEANFKRATIATVAVPDNSPILTLDVTHGKPGDSVGVSLSGFNAAQPGNLTLDGEPIGTFNTSNNGSGTSDIVVPALLPGTYTIDAEDDDGGASSAQFVIHHSSAVTAPSAPTDVTASATLGNVSITWSPPTNDGGSAVTGYEVVASPGGVVCTTSETSCNVTSLASDDDEYTFAITAVNGVGMGAPSGLSNPVLLYTPLSWSSGDEIDGSNVLQSISCPTPSFCAAVDTVGNVLTMNDGVWSTQVLAAGSRLTSISCLSQTFCMAVDYGGDAYSYNGSTWSALGNIDSGGPAFNTVSCPTTSWCMATDNNGGYLTWTSVSGWSSRQLISGFAGISASSCATPTFCAATSGGEVALWDGSSWTAPTDIDVAGNLSSIGCPTPSFCAAVDANGNGVTYTGTSWTDPVSVDGDLRSVSCPSPEFCAAVSANGSQTGTPYIYNNDSWSDPDPQVDDVGLPLAVSCPSIAFCAVVDSDGHVFLGSG